MSGIHGVLTLVEQTSDLPIIVDIRHEDDMTFMFNENEKAKTAIKRSMNIELIVTISLATIWTSIVIKEMRIFKAFSLVLRSGKGCVVEKRLQVWITFAGMRCSQSNCRL